jgi:hypothetical protein
MPPLPPRVTGDFVATVLKMKGGAGAAIPPFLKKIGFVNSDGTPTEIYKSFRNDSLSDAAMAQAIKIGYPPLTEANEYFFRLEDGELLDLIVQVTGAAKDSATAKLTLSTLKILKSFANFEAEPAPAPKAAGAVQDQNINTAGPARVAAEGRLGINFGYTINLNLPATSDQAVFNAIFRSLKENLLSDDQS